MFLAHLLVAAALAAPPPTPVDWDAHAFRVTPDVLAQDAILDWSGAAPVVVWVRVIDAVPHPGVRGAFPTTSVTLIVDRVLRDDVDLVGVGDVIDLELPGADFGGWGVLTSRAPVLVTGDEGLFALDAVGETLAPARGNESFLGGFDGELELCVNPTPDVLGECADRQIPTLSAPGPALGPDEAVLRLDHPFLASLPL